MSEQAKAAFDAIAGGMTVKGRAWWHFHDTEITLNAQQVEHLKRRALAESTYGKPTRAEITAIDFSYGKCCGEPRVRIELFRDPVVEGFKPKRVGIEAGCSVCGAV